MKLIFLDATAWLGGSNGDAITAVDSIYALGRFTIGWDSTCQRYAGIAYITFNQNTVRT